MARCCSASAMAGAMAIVTASVISSCTAKMSARSAVAARAEGALVVADRRPAGTKGMSGNKRAIWGISIRRDSVVPLAVELGALDVDGGHLRVRDDNAAGVSASVEFAAHGEAGFGGGGRDQFGPRT